MTSMPWFRFYSEFRSDPKMKRMPIHHRYAFIVLLCLASDSKKRGVILGLDDDDFAYEVELSKEDWLTLKAKFKVKGLIDFDSEQVKIVNWDERQYTKPSDSQEAVRERVARCRAKKKADLVTTSNALQSDTVTPVTRFCNADSDSDPDSDSDSDKPLLTPLRKLIEEDTEENKLNLVFEENRIDQGLSTPLTDKPEAHDKTNSIQEDQISVAMALQNLNKDCESFTITTSTSTKAIPAYEARFYRKGKRFPWKTGDGINDYDEGFVEYLNKWQQGMSKDKSKTDCYADVIAYLHNHESPNYNPNPDKNGIGEGLGKIFAHWEQYQRSLKAKTQSRITAPSLNDADIASLRKKEIFTPPPVPKKKTRNA